MKTLYIDCTAGISGDMLLAALREIAEGTGTEVKAPVLADQQQEHGRSYARVKEIINSSDAGETAKAFALNIYEAIAKAEAQVHGKTLETVHFHEVGRNQAIENALGIGAAMEALGLATAGRANSGTDRDPIGCGSNDRTASSGSERDQSSCQVLVSPIYDGTGIIDCAHGRISVPVPAVEAMKSQCPDYEFRTAEEVKTEMVTPSGLAALIGIGAKPAKESWNPTEEGMISIATAEAAGTRDTGRGGLKLTLYDCRKALQELDF